jgi:hypothetical protein
MVLYRWCRKRIAITFEDPKAFTTPQQAEKYHERSISLLNLLRILTN